VAVGIAISIALLGLLLWRIDLLALRDHLARTHWGWALTSGALNLAGIWTRARRWHYLFPPGSSPPALFRAAMIGYMANNLLPLRAGEIVRVYVVARNWSHGFWLPLATLVVERVLDGLALVLILAGLMLVVPVPPALRWAAVVLLSIDGIATLALVAVATIPGQCRRLIVALTARRTRLQRRLTEIFEMFFRGLGGVRTPRHAVPIAAWSVAVWVAAAVTAWTALLAVRLDLPFTAAWAVLAFVGLGISIPSAPGYIGVFHAAAVLALAMFNVSGSAAVGYAIVYHAAGFVPITVGGWLLLMREHMSLREATRRTAESTLP
jgi:uncharacterized protein (TIRG00374 family)